MRHSTTRGAAEKARVDSPQSQAFCTFAGRFYAFLEREAAHVLELAEADGSLPPRRRSPDGLVDETLLLAWSRFDQRVAYPDLQSWLRAVLSEVLAAAVQHAGETTPEVPCRPTNEELLDDDASSPQWRQCLLLDPRDPVVWEDQLPLSRLLRMPTAALPPKDHV